MKKIPTLFVRDPDDMRHVLTEVTPGCEWVLAGEGVATRKYDGTCVRIAHAWHDGPQLAVWVRREVKPGKLVPVDFERVDYDPVTGKSVGWEPYGNSGFAAFIDEALNVDPHPADWPEGTYELCGPKVNRNPEHFPVHRLIRHADAEVFNLPPVLDYAVCRRAVLDLAEYGHEGIVWHHLDGRMAKLKARDFQ